MKVLTIFGTRPEAIKMAPVIKKLKENKDFDCRILVTAQHREMLDQVLEVFPISPDWDLDIMTHNQTLYQITSSVIRLLEDLLRDEKPDLILVQGDTTTTFVAGLAAYYQKIKTGHIEAGLRSADKYNPFPEEINRKLCDHLSDLHFAPTETARRNLLNEGIKDKAIWVTGNTVIDALLWAREKFSNPQIKLQLQEFFKSLGISSQSRIILVTGHRRESFGTGIKNICQGLAKIAREKKVEIVYSVHFNPNVRRPVERILNDCENIHLIDPPSYLPFVYLMDKSYLILTDSGGIQEEAPSLGKPVLVMRAITERTEGIEAGTAKLVGTNPEKIYDETKRLLFDPTEYDKMARATNPYGDGKAATRIVHVLKSLTTLLSL